MGGKGHETIFKGGTNLDEAMPLIGIISLLKLVSAIFHQISIFSSNERPSKTMKNVFYFIKKALFVLEIFKSL